MDLDEVERARNNIKGKGFKGAVGTSASYLELNDRLIEPLSHLKNGSVTQSLNHPIEQRVLAKFGLAAFPVATQTYPRKQDWLVMNALAGVAQSLYKLAFDLRVLQSPPIGEWAEPFGAKQVGSSAMPFKRNPINAELSVLRPSLLPNLLGAAARNQSRNLPDVALFELGPRFWGAQPGEQEVAAAGVRVGRSHERHWAEPPRAVDVFDARADALAVLAAGKVKPDAVRVVAEGAGHYHPGRRGQLMLGPQTVLAEFGELHPAIVREMAIDGPAVAFEVFLDRMPKPKAKASRARPALKASPFPPVDRDFAFVVDHAAPAETLLAAVRAADKVLIREVALFDVYSGQGLEDGKKSLAVAVRLQAPDHTLSEAEIEAAAKKIVAAAAKATGAVLRT